MKSKRSCSLVYAQLVARTPGAQAMLAAAHAPGAPRYHATGPAGSCGHRHLFARTAEFCLVAPGRDVVLAYPPGRVW